MLKIKILDLFKDCDTEDVLHRLLEPPSQENIHFAMKRLQDLGALDEEWVRIHFHFIKIISDKIISSDRHWFIFRMFRC